MFHPTMLACTGLLAMLLPGICQTQEPLPPTLTLQEALDRRLVSVEPVSLGGHSGECVSLQLQNHSLRPMTLLLPAGTVFEPADGDDQSLVVPVERQLALSGRASEMLPAAAFCTEMGDASPAEESGFALARTANPLLDSLFGYLAAHPELASNADVLQNAIWAITDHTDVGSIFADGQPEVAAFREWICKLTGRENVWYNTVLDTRLDQERRIVRTAVSVQGQVMLNRREALNLQGHVENELGQVVWTFERANRLPAGTLRFRFWLEVEGWESGGYAVVYKNGEEEVIRQEFQI
jgi:hypothetical protein